MLLSFWLCYCGNPQVRKKSRRKKEIFMDMLFIIKIIGSLIFAYLLLLAGRDEFQKNGYMLSWDWVTQSNRKSDLQSILDEARKHSKNCPYCGNNEFLIESLSRGQTYRARHTFICSTCGVEHNMTAKRILTKMKRSKRIQKIIL